MANPTCEQCIKINGTPRYCERPSNEDGECPTIVTPATQDAFKALSSDKPGQPAD